ncbi:MAG: O-antigen ligase family protein [Prolixibacteraceae bacterium]|nr:O-antigen ligase family protein [Burkholderiales bacterium]
MGSISRLPSPVSGREAPVTPSRRTPVRSRPAMITSLGLASFACGTAVGVKLDIVGDLYLLELLVALLALQCLLSRGLGKGFVPSVFLGFLAAGLLTFFGYLLADLMAANEPWQYLKGWGRVALLIVDSAGLMVLAAHGRQHLWWLALGIAVGGVAALAVEGVPLTTWKLGYGEYAVLLAVALAPLLPSFLPTLLISLFGVGCVLADYRSLGAVSLAVSAIMLWHHLAFRDGIAKSLLRVAVVAGIAVMALTALLWVTQEQYSERRQESNIGRYVGLLVAWRAISESPLVGYGSWAADEKFGRMFKAEVERIDRDNPRIAQVSHSLLPHSQLLQVWIEGGLLGLTFFALYAVRLLGALRWFAWNRQTDLLTPLFLFLLVSGIWNLLASPFLGLHRVYIAIVVALISVAAHERRREVNARTGSYVDRREPIGPATR